MSNARRRAEARRRAHGPSTAPETARRLAHLYRLQRLALEEKRLEEGKARPVPTTGPGRRRAKARRNAMEVRYSELHRRMSRIMQVSETFAFPFALASEYRTLLAETGRTGPAYDVVLTDLERRWEGRAYVEVDPNRTQMDGSNRAGFEDCERPVAEGEAVILLEGEDLIEADAVVTHVDYDRRLIYVRQLDRQGWRDVADEARPRVDALMAWIVELREEHLNVLGPLEVGE
jgi:hypothetical protein